MAKLGKEARKKRGRAPKVGTVSELTNLFKNMKGLVLVDNKGLTVAQVTQLRNKLRAGNVRFKMAKNSLIALSMKMAGHDVSAIDRLLVGPTMVAFGMADPVAPAKILSDFIKDNDKLVIKGGFLDGRLLTPADVTELSKLPSKEQLIARMLGSMQAPATNLVYALNATVAKVVHAFSAIQRKKEESEKAA